MRSMKLFMLSIMALASLSVWGQDTAYYVDSYTPESRYVMNDDGTVVDQNTGLMWKRCTEGLSGNYCNIGDVQQYTWSEAMNRASSSVYAGYDDWRLPNIKELSSLIAFESYDPAINLKAFVSTPSSVFWSSTPRVSDSSLDSAFTVDFLSGENKSYLRVAKYPLVRLVRDVEAAATALHH